MTRKVELNIEELEARIAPHCWSPYSALGGGAAVVNFSTNATHGPDLCAPGHTHGIDMPTAAVIGLTRATQGGA